MPIVVHVFHYEKRKGIRPLVLVFSAIRGCSWPCQHFLAGMHCHPLMKQFGQYNAGSWAWRGATFFCTVHPLNPRGARGEGHNLSRFVGCTMQNPVWFLHRAHGEFLNSCVQIDLHNGGRCPME